MAKQGKRVFNITKLETLATSLKKMDDSKYKVQVGIFGEKDARRGAASKGVTNAEIGLIHEMGSVSRNIPRRSFLWDTFTHHGQQLTDSLKPAVKTLLDKGQIDEYLKAVGIACTNLVVEAFHTGGWGAWAPNAYSTIMRKLKGSLVRRKQQAAEVLFEGATHSVPLTDTGALWQSISSRTVKA